jgi:hypothetical protein
MADDVLRHRVARAIEPYVRPHSWALEVADAALAVLGEPVDRDELAEVVRVSKYPANDALREQIATDLRLNGPSNEGEIAARIGVDAHRVGAMLRHLAFYGCVRYATTPHLAPHLDSWTGEQIWLRVGWWGYVERVDEVDVEFEAIVAGTQGGASDD